MKRSQKKSLGQNFLKDPKILQKIADFARIEKDDAVLEIGPGEGTLTQILLEKAEKVVAVEKDEILTEHLKEQFREEITRGRLEIVTGDILEMENLFGGENYILVGNIPYYITGAIFEKFLESETGPGSITFVVQKEVADRIMARDNKESILSIAVKAYGTPEYGGIIKAGSFFPAPKVDSAIISIRNISKERFKGLNKEQFFDLVKKGFSHKRKFLIRNLDLPEEIFEKVGLARDIRAEDLSIDKWFDILRACPQEK